MRYIYFILFLFTQHGFAQDHQFGIQTGPTVTNIRPQFRTGKNLKKTGFAAEINYQYRFHSGIFLGVGFNYNQRGFTAMTGSELQGMYVPEEVKYKLSYISLPMRAGISVGSSIFGFGSAALVPSLIANANSMHDGVSDGEFIYQKINSELSVVNDGDLAVMFEAGGGYKFSEAWQIFVSGCFFTGLTNVIQEGYSGGKDFKHYGWWFSIGGKYSIHQY